MKIIGHETFLVEPRWMFLRIDTDEGISGWGEPIVEGRAETVRAAVDTFMEYLIGRDAGHIEEHWQILTKGGFYRGGPVLSSAVAGIDHALWDIKGKALGVPVYELLGGPVRDKVRIYTWLQGRTPETLAADGREKAAMGFTAAKFCPFEVTPHIPSAAQVRNIVDRVDSLRAAVGDDVDLAIDLHGRFSAAAARRVLPLLEEFLPFFVEEPILPEFSADLGAVAAATSIPIAAGERLFSRWQFRDVLPHLDVAQPDLSHAGGISEVRRIAAMAEAYDVAIAPHCPLGPITFAASLQIDCAIPNFLIQEQALQIGYPAGEELLDYLVDTSVFTFTDGYIDRPTGPGLGIEIDEKAVRRAAEKGHAWRNEIWRHADGSLAEW